MDGVAIGRLLRVVILSLRVLAASRTWVSIAVSSADWESRVIGSPSTSYYITEQRSKEVPNLGEREREREIIIDFFPSYDGYYVHSLKRNSWIPVCWIIGEKNRGDNKSREQRHYLICNDKIFPIFRLQFSYKVLEFNILLHFQHSNILSTVTLEQQLHVLKRKIRISFLSVRELQTLVSKVLFPK